MQIIKFFVIFVAVIGRRCLSEMTIEIKEPDGFAELEEAAIKILTTCYANQHKTILLIGDFPGNFIKRLSSHQSFSIILMDRKRRAEYLIMNDWFVHDNLQNWRKRHLQKRHKIHIVVTMAAHYRRLKNSLYTFWYSAYRNSMASILTLGWSPENKYSGCDGKLNFFSYFGLDNLKNLLNTKLMCRDRTNGIMMYGSNPFTNQAPEPWQLITSVEAPRNRYVSYFAREYREHKGMCKNLDFDKTNDLGGTSINTLRMCHMPFCSDETFKNRIENRRAILQESRRFDFVDYFIDNVNATRNNTWVEITLGKSLPADYISIITRPTHLRAVDPAFDTWIYPHDVECKFLISQFRGNMSQLRKILSVIDNYSWIGMSMVYLITLIFFKFFLRQPLIVGILNLCRLTCNCGLTTLPRNVAPQFYLTCLFFFVVTMQGIFVGDLASLLTHDIPVRQVNSIQDLADLGYKVYVAEHDLIYFDDPIFKGRIILKVTNDYCGKYVARDPSIACLEWGDGEREMALNQNLHVSTKCITTEYISTYMPWHWALEERLNKFMGITLGAGTKMPFYETVEAERLLEADSEEVLVEPEIMTLDNLGFAFAILGIGLGCASISFIVEIMIYRRQNRVTKTRDRARH